MAMTAEVTLRGARIALLEARMSNELASLVERHSGVPYNVPAVREDRQARGKDVAEQIDWLASGSSEAGEERIVILSTGVAVETFLKHASVLGREEELRAALGRALTIARGPKPTAALKKIGVHANVRVAEPYTTRELIDAALPVIPKGVEVLLLNYGERNLPLVEAIEAHGAKVRELSLYEWKLPEDLRPLRRLVDEILERRVSCVAFTSQIQARHLMQIATEMGRDKELHEAFATHTLVAAIGPTCADALRALGIEPHVVPATPKMGPMITTLARYFAGVR